VSKSVRSCAVFLLRVARSGLAHSMRRRYAICLRLRASYILAVWLVAVPVPDQEGQNPTGTPG
jgi:hypothetical protein